MQWRELARKAMDVLGDIGQLAKLFSKARSLNVEATSLPAGVVPRGCWAPVKDPRQGLEASLRKLDLDSLRPLDWLTTPLFRWSAHRGGVEQLVCFAFHAAVLDVPVLR